MIIIILYAHNSILYLSIMCIYLVFFYTHICFRFREKETKNIQFSRVGIRRNRIPLLYAGQRWTYTYLPTYNNKLSGNTTLTHIIINVNYYYNMAARNVNSVRHRSEMSKNRFRPHRTLSLLQRAIGFFSFFFRF